MMDAKRWPGHIGSVWRNSDPCCILQVYTDVNTAVLSHTGDANGQSDCYMPLDPGRQTAPPPFIRSKNKNKNIQQGTNINLESFDATATIRAVIRYERATRSVPGLFWVGPLPSIDASTGTANAVRAAREYFMMVRGQFSNHLALVLAF